MSEHLAVQYREVSTTKAVGISTRRTVKALVTCRPRRFLVAGWFSLDSVIATVGDEMGAQVVAGWLRDAGHACDLLFAPYFPRGQAWRRIDPAAYDGLIFVSGPLVQHDELRAMLKHFSTIRRIALNVSQVPDGLEDCFDVLLERDGAVTCRPDLAMAAPPATSPVVGVALAPPQAEYPDGRQAETQQLIEDWVHERGFAVLPLQMDLLVDRRHELRPEQVESLVQRCDVVISMRLHAMIMAFRCARPVIAVDAVPGGAKVKRQADLLGWPAAVTVDELSRERLDRLLDFCSGPDAFAYLTAARQAALTGIDRLRVDFLSDQVLSGEPA